MIDPLTAEEENESRGVLIGPTAMRLWATLDVARETGDRRLKEAIGELNRARAELATMREDRDLASKQTEQALANTERALAMLERVVAERDRAESALAAWLWGPKL